MKRASFTGRARIGLGAVALAIALGGCDELRKMAGMDSDAGTNVTANAAGTTVNGAAPSPDGSKPQDGAAPADSALATEMAQAASILQTQLPIRVDDVTTITAVRADGTEFVYDMAIGDSIAPAQLETARQLMQSNNQTNVCRDANVARLIGRGATLRHIYTDSEGNSFETRVTSCS